MAYLRLRDYYPTIQGSTLQQLLTDEDSNRLFQESAAFEKIKSMLVQKYDISDEFRDTKTFSYTATYKAKQLIELDATAYSAIAAYALNALTLYQGNVYYNIVAITTGEAFAANKWALIGAQHTLYYIPVPYDEFNVYSSYKRGDMVFWKDKIYYCNQPSIVSTHFSELQYNSTTQFPLSNQFPDTTQTQWTLKTSYSFSGLWPSAVPGDFTTWSSVTNYTVGQRVSYNSIIWQAPANSTNVIPGTDASKWNPVSWYQGDNRNSELVNAMVYITLYKLAPRISPRNVPDVWVKNYDDTIRWLKDCADGTYTTLDMPVKQPRQGTDIIWGSEPKRVNRY